MAVERNVDQFAAVEPLTSYNNLSTEFEAACLLFHHCFIAAAAVNEYKNNNLSRQHVHGWRKAAICTDSGSKTAPYCQTRVMMMMCSNINNLH